MNGDPKMPVVAMGQEYFAEQTRRQEIADELALMSEDELRLLRRGQMNIYNTQLAAAAQQSGVIAPIDFAIFQDHGYRGLYGCQVPGLLDTKIGKHFCSPIRSSLSLNQHHLTLLS